LLSKRPDLRDPEALLKYLQANNPNNEYDELIGELNEFVETNRVYPNLGEFNRDHPITKLIHKQLRFFLNKLRQFNHKKKKSEKWIMILFKKNKEFQKLSVLKRFNEIIMGNQTREKLQFTSRKAALRLLSNRLNNKTSKAFNNLKQFTTTESFGKLIAVQLLNEKLSKLTQKVLSSSFSEIKKNHNLKNKRRSAVSRLLRHFNDRERSRALTSWNQIIKREKLCKFNSKINNMCISLRKNHKHEIKSAFSKWSLKEMRLKYDKMALFLKNIQKEKKNEMYVHMKILYMQEKFSKMCKVLGRFLEFVEMRKRENKMYAFDAMSLDNPWTEKVPKLLACSKVMSAQMCFWKLRLTRHDFLKKRRQRGGGYKIDKLKLVILEKIFTKKISQYFMQIQIGRPNKYL
jgi:hypothetical protein